MKTLVLKKEERNKINAERQKSNRYLEKLELERKTFNEKRSLTLDNLKKSYIENETDNINKKYFKDIKDTEEKIKSLQDTQDEILIDENIDEVKVLKNKQEYLTNILTNTDNMYQSLLRVSNKYFIDIAKTNKTLTYKKFIKEIKCVDTYIEDINRLRVKELLPITLTNYLSKVIDENISLYISSILTGFTLVLVSPYIFIKSIYRIKRIHSYSIKFNQLVKSALTLKDKSTEEISNMINSMKELKRDNIFKEIKDLEDELVTINKRKEEEINNIIFNETESDNQIDIAEKELDDDIVKYKKMIMSIDSLIINLDKEIKLLEKDKKDLLKSERDLYINPCNEDRQVIFPKKILYDFNDNENIWISLISGLYVYNNREDAENLMKLITYEIRNYMKYEAINIYVLDSLMALSLSDLILPNRSNIYVDSMKSEQESRIQVLHDNMYRRKTTIKTVANDINSYNEIQLVSNSSPLSINIIFYYFETAMVLSEKLIQLLTVGEVLGIYLIIFIGNESLDISNLKMYKKYINNIIEITSTGVSQSLFDDFIKRLEIDKK